jgi:TRAP transporter 4TM/12TM fusion protein
MTSGNDELIDRAVKPSKGLGKEAKRTLTRPWKQVVTGLAAAMALFQLAAAAIGTIPTAYILIVHLGFVLALIYLIFPYSPRSNLERPTCIDLVLAALSIATTLYLGIYLEEIYQQMGLATAADIVAGAIAIPLVLEACRRALGKPLPIVALGFFFFALLGRFLPGFLQHSGYSLREIIKILYLTDEGLFGVALATSATYVILFILFGAIMAAIQMSRFLTDFALGVAGWMTGGPAKVATLASGLLGTISGSVSGNVATTGVMTIPLMKSVGYRPSYAGAVECVASAGGQIMPPVMGAAAFLMAQFLGVSYGIVCIAAAMPAILYYVSVWTSVDLRARKEGLKTISRGNVPPLGTTLKNYGHLAIPILAILYFLVIEQYSPIYSALLAIFLALGISFLRSQTRITLSGLIQAFESGVRGALPVAIACATAGFIIGVITLTGFGLVISHNIVKLSFGSLLLTLFLGMVASILLGMELPTTACYIVTSLTIAPALIKMGVNPMAAHFFVFYFAILSTLTPPVALSSFVAAGLAKADPIETGLTGLRLALSGFIIPYMIILKPELMIVNSSALSTLYAFVISSLGIFMLAVVNEGYLLGKLTIPQRALLAFGVMGLLLFGWQGDIIALPLILLVIVMQVFKRKRQTLKYPPE